VNLLRQIQRKQLLYPTDVTLFGLQTAPIKCIFGALLWIGEGGGGGWWRLPA